SAKQTLTRILNNLKGSFFRRRDFSKVLMMIEMALAVDPASRQEIHDRGMIYFLLRRYAEAMADLRTYLKLSPPDDPQIRDVQTMMHRIRAMHN
ncbi:MAG TPA: tetratricopeptide repeat protein, partial [Terriglobia bacterium]|nr:tetratricopeptide repeat protein [Terriglobia bacterium]